MDDNAKNTSSYHLDQEILDARGIDMTVEEVAGLPTTKYSERVQSLKLKDEDLAFLKGLRRRIKNRNSRRRSMEHLRRLTRELRAVRACRDDALEERRALVLQRDEARDRCQRLRQYVAKILKERRDPTEIPTIDTNALSSQPPESPPEPPKKKRIAVTETKTPFLSECFNKIERDKNIFECRIDKLVQQSVNHIYKTEKKVYAKTVFITNEKYSSNVKSMVLTDNIGEDLKAFGELKGMLEYENGEVLNLCVKEGRRKSHGRKQSAPRRIAYCCSDSNDGVLDLKIKKDSQ
ncbi:uncharacterized protein LOC131849058 isoform X2 [Achroia grisella]|uniref:uncharacterized protein LOC131849058 isoform X2 n=1 Tax=Achroia grisella TaxID=688607 RepID=UPI0027D2F7EA|nr:uncharacterized protein LOC131849058 isoform X2 [Achroia grisella]